MRMGMSVPTFGDFADVRALADLAATAEAGGWDGFFVWDHIRWPWADDLVDAWIAMTAIAIATERIRFGPLVTPPARAKVAREAVTLDRLSGGRLILGVGAGDFPEEFSQLGDVDDGKIRAAMLDEALTIVDGLWSGAPAGLRPRYLRERRRGRRRLCSGRRELVYRQPRAGCHIAFRHAPPGRRRAARRLVSTPVTRRPRQHVLY